MFVFALSSENKQKKKAIWIPIFYSNTAITHKIRFDFIVSIYSHPIQVIRTKSTEIKDSKISKFDTSIENQNEKYIQNKNIECGFQCMGTFCLEFYWIGFVNNLIQNAFKGFYRACHFLCDLNFLFYNKTAIRYVLFHIFNNLLLCFLFNVHTFHSAVMHWIQPKDSAESISLCFFFVCLNHLNAHIHCSC